MHKPESVSQHYTAFLFPRSNLRFATAVNGMCDKYISRHRHFGCGNLVRIRGIVNVVYFQSKTPVLTGLSGVIAPGSAGLMRMFMMSQPVSINGFGGLLTASGILITTGENPFNNFVSSLLKAASFHTSPGLLYYLYFQFGRMLTAIQLPSRKTEFLRKGPGTGDAE